MQYQTVPNKNVQLLSINFQIKIKGTRTSLETWLILGLEQETCKMTLEHLVMLESKGNAQERQWQHVRGIRSKLKVFNV